MGRRLGVLMQSRVPSHVGAAASCTAAEGSGGRLVVQASAITGQEYGLRKRRYLAQFPIACRSGLPFNFVWGPRAGIMVFRVSQNLTVLLNPPIVFFKGPVPKTFWRYFLLFLREG